MGYYGKLELKLIAQDLRRKGLSYNEIIKEISVSKNSVSRWCSAIHLTKKQMETILRKKMKGGMKGRLLGANKLHQAKLININKLTEEGIEEVGKLSKREQFLIGVALYAAEGTKFDGKFEFTNANPQMIYFMISWLRRFCLIRENKLRASIWLHDDLDLVKSISYWQKITNIPSYQFQKSCLVRSKPNSLKIRKNIHQFGICSIRYHDVRLHRKLMGWIAGILRDSWYNENVSPVAQW